MEKYVEYLRDLNYDFTGKTTYLSTFTGTVNIVNNDHLDKLQEMILLKYLGDGYAIGLIDGQCELIWLYARRTWKKEGWILNYYLNKK